MQKNENNKMEKIISLCKRRGFIYPASEIYGGFANAFDFGPLGAQLKKNIKDYWWKKFIVERDDIVAVDSAIIQNPKVWEASGHLKSFTDPLVECKKCHQRFRVDHVQEAQSQKSKAKSQNEGGLSEAGLSKEQIAMVVCPQGGEHEFTEAREFNLMFKTFVGVTEDSSAVTYLRPETAQGMFINFKNVTQSTRVKIPFGIGQIGKAFRNEITPGNFIFRTREFEQAEIEYFVKPGEDEKIFEQWYGIWKQFFLDLGLKTEKIRDYEHPKEALAFYSKKTIDIEYEFPFGWSELAGVANRTDYDLKQHNKYSGEDLSFYDEATGERYYPYVIEPTLGIDRTALVCLVDAYDESDGSDDRQAGEVTMRLQPKLAPIKVGIFPLMKKEGMPEIAHGIADKFRKQGINVFYDESGSVGRRYRRQDEIGTPWCITVDFDSAQDATVTLRDRDTMKQERISIDKVVELIDNKLR